MYANRTNIRPKGNPDIISWNVWIWRRALEREESWMTIEGCAKPSQKST